MVAAIYLHELTKRQIVAVKVQRSAADQFIITASVRPRRHGARYQREACEGPTARRDAEERGRKIQVVADLFRETPTQWGNDNWKSQEHNRCKAEVTMRFSSWELDNFVAYLKVRLSTRRALLNVHNSFIFMEGMFSLPDE